MKKQQHVMTFSHESLEKFVLILGRLRAFFLRHRVASMIGGQVFVLAALVIFVLNSVLGIPVFSAFAQTSCPSGDITYTIKAGDTLDRIAAANHTTSQALVQHNQIGNPNLIYAKQQICIPGHAQKVQAAPSGDNVQSIIQSVFGPDAPAAMNIVRCESGNNPNAVNPMAIGASHSEGLFQILYPSTWATTDIGKAHPSQDDVKNATLNAQAAHEIFLRDGHSWREWACQP